ncbi:S-adenosyl-L-methionine-dependent methyltransferases superfamily protein [Actinidia rufa]|uniref:S-adenosyl-L-methionine-dependent methyltransferases superfamily protein n=1 Tax=Actinidia rufa TaxID=165716 RepID=A0A7J0FHJ2_9ERIC|nr:S-adenosyl-L-methionine-dependent methyltransferases superfamily protein [Actinidia rufa]
MADLFHKQADDYAEARPSYPEELFQFIASKTPNHDLVWDVGTGSGQAANALAGIYKNVVATDTSQKQLDFAPKLPNIQYKCTPPTMTMDEVERIVAAQSSLDLVTIAQALHWFDLPTFYHQVKWLLKKPHGVIAAWCYTIPEVNDCVDAIFRPFYVDSKPYWDPARKLVDDKYRGIEFPFERVDGEVDHTGPVEFKTKRVMDLEGFFKYIRSWSAYQTAKEKGVELLRDDVVESFKRAWSEDGEDRKVVVFPVHLRIGKVGNFN